MLQEDQLILYALQAGRVVRKVSARPSTLPGGRGITETNVSRLLAECLSLMLLTPRENKVPPRAATATDIRARRQVESMVPRMATAEMAGTREMPVITGKTAIYF